MVPRRLRDGLTMLWRAPDAVQVGTDPRCAVAVEGLSPAELRWLLTFDAHPGEGPHPGAASAAVPAARRAELLGLLDRAGVLADEVSPRGEQAALGVDAAVLCRLGLPGREVVARRSRRTVCVAGLDAVGAHLAVTLALAGVGTLLLSDDQGVTGDDLGVYGVDDLGAPREARLRSAVRRVRPAVRVPDARRARRRGAARPQGRGGGAPTSEAPPAPSGWPEVWPGATWEDDASGRPDLVVLVRPWTASLRETGRLLGADVPHLLVVGGEIDVEVGPLVVPGRSPCARCVALARTDLDDRWPAVATQLALRPAPGTDRTTVLRAAGLAAQAALAFLDDRPVELVGASASLGPGGILPRVQPWAPHPGCGCGAHDAGAHSPPLAVAPAPTASP